MVPVYLRPRLRQHARLRQADCFSGGPDVFKTVAHNVLQGLIVAIIDGNFSNEVGRILLKAQENWYRTEAPLHQVLERNPAKFWLRTSIYEHL
jgi:hypothetical protein